MRDLPLFLFVRELGLTKNFTWAALKFSSSAAPCTQSSDCSPSRPCVTGGHQWPTPDPKFRNPCGCAPNAPPGPISTLLFSPFIGVLVFASPGEVSPPSPSPEETTKIKVSLPQSALLELNRKAASQADSSW